MAQLAVLPLQRFHRPSHLGSGRWAFAAVDPERSLPRVQGLWRAADPRANRMDEQIPLILYKPSLFTFTLPKEVRILFFKLFFMVAWDITCQTTNWQNPSHRPAR